MHIAPSILAADFADLARDIERLDGEVEMLHVDCMDGHYVPNLTIGPPVVASLRERTDCLLDCHLMVSKPEVLLEGFAEAGADGCTIHVELGDPTPLLERIRELGMRTGLSLEPDTPVSAVEPYLDMVDLVLVMSVKTGFGGQSFRPEAIPKIQQLCRIRSERHLSVDLQVDGGIKIHNAHEVASAGADILVAGTAIFNASDPAQAVRDMKAAAWR